MENGPEKNTKNHEIDEQAETEQEKGAVLEKISFLSGIDSVLKNPTALFRSFEGKLAPHLFFILLVTFLGSIFAYGAVLGTFSNGLQIVIAGLKISYGMFLSAVICLPSLYIFSSISGIRMSFLTCCGIYLTSLTACSIMLIGFAPVVWIFSQSTDSVIFIAVLHLVFLAIGLVVFFKMLLDGFQQFSKKHSSQMFVWLFIFVMVLLQMSTTLRPLFVPGDSFFAGEKKFFLEYWEEIVDEKID